jgi:hypothetical protein
MENLQSDLVVEAGVYLWCCDVYSDTQASQAASAFDSAGKPVAQADCLHRFADDE